MAQQSSSTGTTSPPVGAWAGAIAGAVAVGGALATGELVSTAAGQSQTPVLAVGAEFVDRFAASLKEIAVAIFGTNDKVALVTGTVVVVLGLGAIAGLLGRRWPWLVPALVGALALVGVAAQLADARSSEITAVIGAVLAFAVGVVLWRVLTRARDRTTASAGGSRRRFLAMSGLAAVGSAVAAVASRALVPTAMADVTLPEPQQRVPLPTTADTAAFEADGISPYVTASEDFYRIDTALTVPRIDPTTWKLEISGMVDEPITLDLDQILAMPSVERPVTLQCVSNEVGGDLVDNAVWQGVPLLDVLAMAGVQADAEQVFTTSVDGFTAGFPVTALDGDRTALLAYAMNGEPLLPEHGFPVRLVVAGLYGYVSATKWLSSIELTTWADRDGFWIPRGWAKEGPIKLASRIDVPGPGDQFDVGAVVIGGVAWLPSTGVGAVEVSVDGGDWTECELAPVANDDTWVQWRLPLPDLAAGPHHAVVRARDADGTVQTDAVAPPAPDGSSGYHSREFDVVG